MAPGRSWIASGCEQGRYNFAYSDSENITGGHYTRAFFEEMDKVIKSTKVVNDNYATPTWDEIFKNVTRLIYTPSDEDLGKQISQSEKNPSF